MDLYRGAKAVTPHDTNPINPDGHAIYGLTCGVAGNITCRFIDAPADVVIPLIAGFVYGFRVSHIRATGTTATGLVHLW